MDNIKITLETLYDILLNEKKKEDLQKLESSFFADVVSYLREKKALLEAKRDSREIFAAGERDKIEYELRSIKRVLKELYERREKKIIDIALNRSRTGSDIIDTSAMLREEKEFYEKILKNLDSYRRGIFLNVSNGEFPSITGETEKKISLSLAERKEKILAELQSNHFSKYEGAPAMAAEETEDNGTESSLRHAGGKKEEPQPHQPAMASVRFLHPTPSFVWKDMKVYGPFEKGDTTEIFPEVAELLVKKGRAEKV